MDLKDYLVKNQDNIEEITLKSIDRTISNHNLIVYRPEKIDKIHKIEAYNDFIEILYEEPVENGYTLMVMAININEIATVKLKYVS